MKRLLLVLMMFGGLVQMALAVDVYGLWATQKKEAEIRIQKCGADVCGVISKAVDPNAVDSKNEDPKLRDRSMIGLQLFRLQKTDNPKRWEGKLYNPDDGRTYKGLLKFLSDNEAKIEGCFLFICLGETWARIE